MQDASELRRALAAHLDYYRELGIAGISRDPVWRARRVDAAPTVDAIVEQTSEPPAEVVEQSRVEAALTPITADAATGGEDVASDDMPRARNPRKVLDELRVEIGPQC